MEKETPLLRAMLGGVLHELDDDPLGTLSAAGIKGTPSDECGCPVAKYVVKRLSDMYDTARTGRTVDAAIMYDRAEVWVRDANGRTFDTATLDGPRYQGTGACAFARRFDQSAHADPQDNPYAALIG